ncbi:hypothetical protein DW663_01270 [Fusobacterium mortiferum]|uniref:Uncharacterized protein n=2 Tax=Fusobacterium mortiferum TaxID=850 RepID=A0A414Q2N7_FUSMR|nr:hypothetical protein DW663_01270 [Fusobacterium mortiferum]
MVDRINKFNQIPSFVSSIVKPIEFPKTHEIFALGTSMVDRINKFNQIPSFVSSAVKPIELPKTHEIFALGTNMVDRINKFNQIPSFVSSVVKPIEFPKTHEIFALGTSMVDRINKYNQIPSFVSSVIKSDFSTSLKFIEDYQNFQDRITLINSFDKLKYKINISHSKKILETNNFYKSLCGFQNEYTEEDIQTFKENISEISSTFDFELESLISEDDFKLPDINFYCKQIICLFIVIFTSISPDIIESLKEILNYLIYELPENKEINAIIFYGELATILISAIKFFKSTK